MSKPGFVDIYVDGSKIASLDEYNASIVWQKTWASPAFEPGVHIVQFKHISGTYVDIDAIQVVAAAGTYDDNHTSWQYSGVWSPWIVSGPYGGAVNSSATLGDSAQFTFTGEQFKLFFTAAYNLVVEPVETRPGGCLRG